MQFMQLDLFIGSSFVDINMCFHFHLNIRCLNKMEHVCRKIMRSTINVFLEDSHIACHSKCIHAKNVVHNELLLPYYDCCLLTTTFVTLQCMFVFIMLYKYALLRMCTIFVCFITMLQYGFIIFARVLFVVVVVETTSITTL